RQRGGAVDALLCEQGAQLAHDPRQDLVPRRGRYLSPQCLGELVAWHRPALLRYQIGERHATLPPREASFVDHLPVALQRHSTDVKYLWLRTTDHFIPKI